MTASAEGEATVVQAAGRRGNLTRRRSPWVVATAAAALTLAAGCGGGDSPAPSEAQAVKVCAETPGTTAERKPRSSLLPEKRPGEWLEAYVARTAESFVTSVMERYRNPLPGDEHPENQLMIVRPTKGNQLGPGPGRYTIDIDYEPTGTGKGWLKSLDVWAADGPNPKSSFNYRLQSLGSAWALGVGDYLTPGQGERLIMLVGSPPVGDLQLGFEVPSGVTPEQPQIAVATPADVDEFLSHMAQVIEDSSGDVTRCPV